jgi:hypothetical protein
MYSAFGDPVLIPTSPPAPMASTKLGIIQLTQQYSLIQEGLMISTLTAGDQIPLIVTQSSVSLMMTGGPVLYQSEF